MSHTPGPWKVDVDSGAIYGPFEVLGPTGTMLGMLAKRLLKDHEESLANARLIAAAPELLEALEAITPKGYLCAWWCPNCRSYVTATFTEHCVCCGTYLTDCQPSLEWWVKAQAAIAKAKGENHA